MAVSDYINIRKELRMNVRDNYGVQWSDTALDTIINDAQREYSFYAQNLVGEYEIKSSASSMLQLPEDFISPIKVINKQGEDIPILSWRELVRRYDDFRKRKGEKAEAVCFDFDGYSFVRIFPSIPQDVEVGRLIYTRYSVNDRLEVKNIEAVKEHCLIQMAFVTGQAKYAEHYKNFVRLIDGENRSQRELKIRKVYRTGVYF